MERLSPTARVILGMLAVEPKSGYDIKTVVDKSTRFFWAASYGQIYPELKRLAERGLIEPESEAEGGRRRTSYRITAAGREAFTTWVREPGVSYELRDEGLLKLFFAGVLEREDAIAVLEEIRANAVAKREALRGIEDLATSAERFGPRAVLHYGLGLSEFTIEWCDEHLKELKEND
jgi:DNA-binding PadR family transcriptional regulator